MGIVTAAMEIQLTQCRYKVHYSDNPETPSRIETMIFDITGTITRGEFTITDFSVVADISIETLLFSVSSIECKLSYPMATALVECAMLHSIKPAPENVEIFQNFPKDGILGTIDGRDIYIGKWRIDVDIVVEACLLYLGRVNLILGMARDIGEDYRGLEEDNEL